MYALLVPHHNENQSSRRTDKLYTTYLQRVKAKCQLSIQCIPQTLLLNNRAHSQLRKSETILTDKVEPEGKATITRNDETQEGNIFVSERESYIVKVTNGVRSYSYDDEANRGQI